MAEFPELSERGGASSGPVSEEEVRQELEAVLGAERQTGGFEDTPSWGNGKLGPRGSKQKEARTLADFRERRPLPPPALRPQFGPPSAGGAGKPEAVAGGGGVRRRRDLLVSWGQCAGVRCVPSTPQSSTVVGRSGYRALLLGDFGFQQSSFGFLGSPKDYLFPEPGSVGPGADAPQTWPSCLCHVLISFLGFLLLLITFPISGWFALKTVPTYERMIVFRLGRICTPGPGMVLLLLFVDSFQRGDLRTRVFSVPPCKLASKDGAVLSVGADVQFHIWDPVLSGMTVKDLNTAACMKTQNAMTKALLKRPLREIQMEKFKISDQLLLEVNNVTRAWGLKVDHVELAVEAMLQLPQDSPLQLAPHLLGVGMSSVAGCALPLGQDTLEIMSEVQLPAPHIGTGPSLKQPVAEGLLTTLQPYLSETLASQVGAGYQFNVILPSGSQSLYFLDLTTGGRVGHGVPDGIPDVEVEVAEADLRALLCRELWPLGAYMSEQMKVKGDLPVAMKLEAVQSEP
ncbi:LOW QUALITY PROTEIN: stomatin-like protein 1 [Glossophaga mutica]